MPFVVPTFNLPINVWHNGAVPPAAPDLVTVANLTPGRRAITPFVGSAGGATNPANMYLLLPIGTDIRDSKAATGDDLVEVPAGTGRFYTVRFVDDVGAGFANEHRLAQIEGIAPWPVPFPANTVPLPVVGGPSCELGTPILLNVNYSIVAAVPDDWWMFISNPMPVLGSQFTVIVSGLGTAGSVFAVPQGICPSLGPTIPAIVVAVDGTYIFNTNPAVANRIYGRVTHTFGGGPTFTCTFRFTQP